MTSVRRTAFTLVELLVVIGIIALLISILLPALNTARRMANLVACKSNLRQVGIELAVYQNDSKGSYPWGMVYARVNPTNWSGLATSDGYTTAAFFMNWASLLNANIYHLRGGGLATGWPSNGISVSSGLPTPDASGIFRCPEATAQGLVFYNPVQYGVNMVVMPNPRFEYFDPATSIGGWAATTNQPQLAPLKAGQVFSDTAVMWDTNLDSVNEGGSTAKHTYNVSSDSAGLGNSWGYSGIDGNQLADPSVPEFRFRSSGGVDPYLGVVGRQQSEMIYFPSNKGTSAAALASNTDHLPKLRTDADPSQIQGMRFRHMKNTQANVLFADGSVQTFTLNQNRPGPVAGSASTDFMRYMLMPKWPSNMHPSKNPLVRSKAS